MATDKLKPRTDNEGPTIEQRREQNPREHTPGMHNWPDWLNLFAGIWLVFAPTFAVEALGATAAWNHYLAGLAISLVALLALARPGRWQEWTNLALGIWVFLAPFLLGFWGIGWALWNHVIIGALVLGLAVYALAQHQRLLRAPAHL